MRICRPVPFSESLQMQNSQNKPQKKDGEPSRKLVRLHKERLVLEELIAKVREAQGIKRITKEEAVKLAFKADGYSEQEIIDVLKDPNEVQEVDSNWRQHYWNTYGEKVPEKYYPDCWIVSMRPADLHRRMIKEDFLLLDGPEEWYWIDKWSDAIVLKGTASCG